MKENRTARTEPPLMLILFICFLPAMYKISAGNELMLLRFMKEAKLHWKYETNRVLTGWKRKPEPWSSKYMSRILNTNMAFLLFLWVTQVPRSGRTTVSLLPVAHHTITHLNGCYISRGRISTPELFSLLPPPSVFTGVSPQPLPFFLRNIPVSWTDYCWQWNTLSRGSIWHSGI